MTDMYQHNGSDAFPEFNAGGENIAYMRELPVRDIQRLLPMIELPDALATCWVLFSFDGEPLAVASDQTDLANNAFYNDMMTILPN